jgi:hypothetical protein
MISSVRPTVSARTGLTGYISAVSQKVTPASSAMSAWAWPSASVFCVPQVIVPRHSSETVRPVLPRVRVCIGGSFFYAQRLGRIIGAAKAPTGYPPNIPDGLTLVMEH